MKQITKHYVIKTVSQTVSYVILGLFLLLALFISLPSLFGYKIFMVESPSMSPTIKINSAIIVSEKNLSELKKGDIITFYAAEGSQTTVTHRIEYCSYEDDEIITKGDTNTTTDAKMRYSRVIGKVVYSVPNVGGIISFLKTKVGIVILIVVPIAAAYTNSIIQRKQNAKIKEIQEKEKGN